MPILIDVHNLTVGLPLEGKWELGGYPAYIDQQLIDPRLTKYNVLGHHFRYNREKLNQFMYPDTKYVSLVKTESNLFVQDTLQLFVHQLTMSSLCLAFSKIKTLLNNGWVVSTPHSVWASSMLIQPSTTTVTLIGISDQRTTCSSILGKWTVCDSTNEHTLSKNAQKLKTNWKLSYDVTRDQDQAYVTQAISEMDENFTLILLTDFFDESLIMMKHLLCWDWDDIVYIKFKMRTDDSKAEVSYNEVYVLLYTV